MNLLRPKLYTQFIVVCILGDFTNAATCNLPIPFRNVVRMATIMAVLFTIRGVTTLLFAMRNGGVDAPCGPPPLQGEGVLLRTGK